MFHRSAASKIYTTARAHQHGKLINIGICTVKFLNEMKISTRCNFFYVPASHVIKRAYISFDVRVSYKKRRKSTVCRTPQPNENEKIFDSAERWQTIEVAEWVDLLLWGIISRFIGKSIDIFQPQKIYIVLVHWALTFNSAPALFGAMPLQFFTVFFRYVMGFIRLNDKCVWEDENKCNPLIHFKTISDSVC